MAKYSALLLASLLLTLQGGAWAMAGGPDGMSLNMMEDADTDHDGKISFDEFKSKREKSMREHFRMLDANGDGFVDKAEAQKGRERLKERMKKRQEQLENLKQDKSI